MEDRLKDKVLAGKYRIGELFDESPGGRTYRATHLLIGSPVTVKVLERGDGFDEDRAARFSEEARTVSRISHPNILNITDFGQDVDGTIYSVMEASEGETLGARLLRLGMFQPAVATRIILQVAAALSAAHSKGVFHGSLSSDKVTLSPIANGAELVKVRDIGAFEPLPDTEVEIVPDEAAYAAPELFGEGARPDERSEVYSLGVLYYELLAGERPFAADSIEELREKHAQVPPPPMAAFRDDLPEGVETVLLTALAKDPDKRYQSVQEFANAVSDSVEGDENADPALLVPAAAAAAAPANNIWKTAFIVLVGISVLSVGMIYWTNTRQRDPATSLQPDANGNPVQPLNPATGVGERSSLERTSDTLSADPDAIPEDIGGDGYDPWANPGAPRPGQPNGPIEPGGDIVTVPGGSIFMPNPDGSGVILVPKPVPAKTPEPGASPSATPTPGNSNTRPPATPQPRTGTSTPPPSTPRPTPSGDDGSGG